MRITRLVAVVLLRTDGIAGRDLQNLAPAPQASRSQLRPRGVLDIDLNRLPQAELGTTGASSSAPAPSRTATPTSMSTPTRTRTPLYPSVDMSPVHDPEPDAPPLPPATAPSWPYQIPDHQSHGEYRPLEPGLNRRQNDCGPAYQYRGLFCSPLGSAVVEAVCVPRWFPDGMPPIQRALYAKRVWYICPIHFHCQPHGKDFNGADFEFTSMVRCVRDMRTDWGKRPREDDSHSGSGSGRSSRSGSGSDSDSSSSGSSRAKRGRFGYILDLVGFGHGSSSWWGHIILPDEIADGTFSMLLLDDKSDYIGEPFAISATADGSGTTLCTSKIQRNPLAVAITDPAHKGAICLPSEQRDFAKGEKIIIALTLTGLLPASSYLSWDLLGTVPPKG